MTRKRTAQHSKTVGIRKGDSLELARVPMASFLDYFAAMVEIVALKTAPERCRQIVLPSHIRVGFDTPYFHRCDGRSLLSCSCCFLRRLLPGLRSAGAWWHGANEVASVLPMTAKPLRVSLLTPQLDGGPSRFRNPR